MSFKKPKVQRPFTKSIEWKGTSGAGHFQWYDKDVGKNITINLDRFIVLEELKSLSGYNKQASKGIWSNEVMNLKSEVFEVRLGNEIKWRGVYSEVKDAVKSAGGKFTQVLYALVDGEIVRILLSAAGCSAWIEKDFDPMSMQCGVKVDGKIHTDGTIPFDSPVFVPTDLTPEEFNLANDACDKIEAWLKVRNDSYEPSDPEDTDSREAPADEAPSGDPPAQRKFSDGAPDEEEIPF